MESTDSVFIFVRQAKLKTAPGGPIPNLLKYGDRIIADLTYQLFFVGSVWDTEYLTQQADPLDTALKAALGSADCNDVFIQYFPDETTISATRQDNWKLLPWEWPELVYGKDLRKMAQLALDKGWLPASGLDSFALALVLPPGTILSADTGPSLSPGENSMEGLGAYHGQLTLDQNGTPLSVYFCVSVWNDGSDGAAIPADGDQPAWAPWENTCAALYHEMGELRLCPNRGNAPPVKDPCCPPQPGDTAVENLDLGWLVWYQTTEPNESGWQEAGDLSVLWAGALPQRVFCKGTGDLDGVPIQALWSNALKKPFIPPSFVAQNSSPPP